jgi:hypothetical protein
VVLLIAVVLLGAALIPVLVRSEQRQGAAFLAATVLLGLIAAGIATVPEPQSLRLALPLLPGSPAAATLWLLAAISASGGAAFGWALRAPPATRDPNQAPPDPKDEAARAHARRERSVVAVCLAAALLAAALGQIGLPRGLLVGLFAAATIIAGLEFRETLYSGLPEVRSNWGGLGGGLGGWEMSRAAVLLLIVMIFAGAAVAAAVGAPPVPAAGQTAVGEGEKKASPASAKPPATTKPAAKTKEPAEGE